MPNGWLPNTAAEFFTELTREQRIQMRRPKGQTQFVDLTAIDASDVSDTEPLDSYVEGYDDDYPVPVAPGVGDLPPDYVESSDLGDTLPETGPIVLPPLMLPAYLTADRPTPSEAGVGGMILDLTVGLPLFSDGTDWKTFDGTVS